jgi:hypothetical protein
MTETLNWKNDCFDLCSKRTMDDFEPFSLAEGSILDVFDSKWDNPQGKISSIYVIENRK